MKVCSKCKVEKEFIKFSKNLKGKNGLRANCKECDKKYHFDNKEVSIKKSLKWRNDNKEYNKIYHKEYRDKNKEECNKRISNWRKTNKSYSANYHKKRREIDPLYKFICNTRTNINFCFKRGTNQYKKTVKTEFILGCTINEFRNYISFQFKKNMNLENYGKWHLDHIIPISSANTKEEIIKLCHYTNYQPLWAKENIKKSNKIINKQLKLI